ncbi:hypothetical protein [Methanocaldococcus sp.]
MLEKERFIDFKKAFLELNLPKIVEKEIDERGINLNDIAIGEFSGRDSVAAIIKAMEDVDTVLPIVVFIGTDYGDVNIFYKNWEFTNKRIKVVYGDNKILLPLTFMFEPELWRALNGRFLYLINKKFGFYTPCIGCHAYLRIMRIPIAKHLGEIIISGERVYHNGDFKVDQVEEVLNTYKKICEKFNVKLLYPIKYVKDNKEIKKILGDNWEQGKRQFKCVFSGNYRDKDGKVIYEREKIIKFLEDFIYPASIKILEEGYNNNFRYIEIVKKFL